jgi:uncharacterized protein (TIGR00369 family)
MTRFVVGSFLLALVELIGFAAYTATHRVVAGVASYDQSGLTRAPASRSRSPVPSFESLVRVPRAAGTVTFAVDPAEKYHNPIGMVHGGAAAALLDPVMGWAVRPFLPAGAGSTTLDLDIRYAKPITVATGTIVASGTVLHHGRRTATAEGRLGAADTGALLAHSPSTLLVLS